jgi:hypothetical protein
MSKSESDVVRGAVVVIEAAATEYTDIYALRAAVNLIPGVGGALDALISGEGARIEKRRIAKQLEDLRLEMALFDAAKLDRDFIKSDECYDWFALLVERTVRTGDQEKLAALRRVFVNGLTVKHSRGALKEIILRHVGDMTGAHLAVLRHLTTITQAKPSHPLIPEGAVMPIEIGTVRNSVDGVEPAEEDAVINDLLNMGILEFLSSSAVDVDRTRVLLSPFGWAFVAFMKETD